MNISEIIEEMYGLMETMKGHAEAQLIRVRKAEAQNNEEQAKQAFNRMYAYNKSVQEVGAFIKRIERSFNNYYFTFGSWEKFPYHNSYLVVKADSTFEAIKKFRKKYPNTEDNCLCCSSYYTEPQWHEFAERYYSNPPEEIIY